MVEKIYFNGSLPRSGSTLLQNILAQNPRFYCTPTSGVAELLYLARKMYTDGPPFRAQDPKLMRSGFLGYCKAGLFGFYNAVTDRPVVFDKSREWMHHYEFVDAFYPSPKIIVCVRDLRAILSSMEKLFRSHRYLHDYDDEFGSSTMLSVPNRVTRWLGTMPVGPSVLQLNDAVQKGTARHMHFLRFEDLTTDPASSLRKLYAYLGEEPFQHDFENVEQLTHEDDSHYPFYGDHQIRQQVRPVPPDYWDVLGKDLCTQIVQRFPLFYKTFYPEKKP